MLKWSGSKILKARTWVRKLAHRPPVVALEVFFLEFGLSSLHGHRISSTVNIIEWNVFTDSWSVVESYITAGHLYSLPQKKVNTFVRPGTRNWGGQMESRGCVWDIPCFSSCPFCFRVLAFDGSVYFFCQDCNWTIFTAPAKILWQQGTIWSKVKLFSWKSSSAPWNMWQHFLLFCVHVEIIYRFHILLLALPVNYYW